MYTYVKEPCRLISRLMAMDQLHDRHDWLIDTKAQIDDIFLEGAKLFKQLSACIAIAKASYI